MKILLILSTERGTIMLKKAKRIVDFLGCWTFGMFSLYILLDVLVGRHGLYCDDWYDYLVVGVMIISAVTTSVDVYCWVTHKLTWLFKKTGIYKKTENLLIEKCKKYLESKGVEIK